MDIRVRQGVRNRQSESDRERERERVRERKRERDWHTTDTETCRQTQIHRETDVESDRKKGCE